jgi:dihydrodiol dehydrogenase / D-xylose 1-dehydrogenase (NADP)
VNGIKHTIVAAALSCSTNRVKDFLKDAGAPEDAKPYGNYRELVSDANIDIIYVAMPYNHHY